MRITLEQHGRPYPIDKERKKRVMRELVEHDLTITQLAKKLGLKQQAVSAVISGRRLSPKTEAKIAAFFGIDQDYLFPVRTLKERIAMREQEQGSANGNTEVCAKGRAA